MNINTIKLYELIEALNNQGFLITIVSFFIILPFYIFVFDGFKLSKNKNIRYYQLTIFIALLVIIFGLLIYLFDIEIIKNVHAATGDNSSNANKDPHAELFKKGIEAAKQLGDKIGDGAAAAAGAGGMAKLVATSAPFPVKVASIALGSFAGVVGKKGAQSAYDALSAITGNSSNTNQFIDSRLLQDYPNFIQSENNINFLQQIFNLFNSNNKIEVLLSSMLIINVINFLLLILAFWSLALYVLSQLNLKFNWLVKHNILSESNRQTLVLKLGKMLNLFQKSIVANLFIIFIGILICDIYSIYLSSMYVTHIEQFSNYYLDFINSNKFK